MYNGDLKPGPQACEASTLPTDPFPYLPFPVFSTLPFPPLPFPFLYILYPTQTLAMSLRSATQEGRVPLNRTALTHNPQSGCSNSFSPNENQQPGRSEVPCGFSQPCRGKKPGTAKVWRAHVYLSKEGRQVTLLGQPLGWVAQACPWMP